MLRAEGNESVTWFLRDAWSLYMRRYPGRDISSGHPNLSFGHTSLSPGNHLGMQFSLTRTRSGLFGVVHGAGRAHRTRKRVDDPCFHLRQGMKEILAATV